MKQPFSLLSLMALFCSLNANSQSFSKGALLISLSEGSMSTLYTSSHFDGGHEVINKGHIDGTRDPLTLEYGLSSKWGIGLNMGGDILNVDPGKFYNFPTTTGQAKVITSELTIDGHYHYYVTKKADLSMLTSFGPTGVLIKGNDGDRAYQYNACGAIFRVGAQARYYFLRRFGFHAILSAYSANCSSTSLLGNTFGNGYSTNIKGVALEFGFCFRFLGHKISSEDSASPLNKS